MDPFLGTTFNEFSLKVFAQLNSNFIQISDAEEMHGKKTKHTFGEEEME